MAAAVLAGIAIAGEEVAAVEFDALFGEAVVAQQADDSGDSDFEADGFHPVVLLAFELGLVRRDIGPGFKVVTVILGASFGLVNLDYFRKIAAEHAERTLGGNHADRRVQTVEYEYFGSQAFGSDDRTAAQGVLHRRLIYDRES